LVHFDPDRETVKQVDASLTNGTGYALLQKHVGHCKLTNANSMMHPYGIALRHCRAGYGGGGIGHS
jgi:hypothetical protein